MIIYLPIYTIFCIALAYNDSVTIKEGFSVNHKLNGFLHLIWAGVAVILFEWYHFFTVLLIGRVVFDTALNLFRGVGLDYVSPSPKSKVDIIEKKVFGNKGILPKLIYIALIVVLLISCSPEKEIQVHPQIMTLIEVQKKQRGGYSVALLRWQTGEMIYWEFRNWPCNIPIGAREMIYLTR